MAHHGERADDPVVDTGDRPAPPMGAMHRARTWSHRSRTRRLVWRTVVLLAGVMLIGAGIAMLVLPGPGWAAIILGLVVLASEYAWAHRVLSPVRRVADRAAEAAMDPARRRRNLVLLGFATLIAAAAIGWYVSIYGVSLDGARWLPGI